MRKAIDNYARGKQREVEAWKGETIRADSGRFICPECLENVALTTSGHFRHKNRTAQSIECDRRVDSSNRTAYERMGLPLYLCKQSDGRFYLGIGFSGQDQETLISAENKGAYLTIGDGFHKESRYNISTDRFSQNKTVIIPVDYRPAGNGYYRMTFSESTPPKLKRIWTERSDIWGSGQFFRVSETNSRKIRPLGTIVTDEEYYFTGNTWRFERYKSFVSAQREGYLYLSNEQVSVYKFVVRKSKASDAEFKSFADLLRNAYKVNLLVGESFLSPIWPPCIEDDGHFLFQKTVRDGHFLVQSPNETPVVYRYYGGTYLNEEIHKSSPATYGAILSDTDIPICIDRAFNGNIQFLCRREIALRVERPFVDIIDADGKTIIGVQLTAIKNKEYRCVANFPATIHVKNVFRKDYCKSLNDEDGVVLTGMNWDDEITVFDHSGKCVLSFTFIRTRTETVTSDEMLLREIAMLSKGPVENVTPRVLALYKTLDDNAAAKMVIHKYIKTGRIPSSIVALLLKRTRSKSI